MFEFQERGHFPPPLKPMILNPARLPILPLRSYKSANAMELG